MNCAFPASRLFGVLIAAWLLCTAALSAQDFYQQGEAMSQRVSSALSRLFRGGNPPPQPVPQTRYQPAPQQRAAPVAPNRNYQTAPQTRYVQPAAPTQPRYQQAPPSKPTTSSTKRSSTTKNSGSASKQKASTGSSRKKNYSPPVVEDEPAAQKPAKQQETVVMAPRQPTTAEPTRSQPAASSGGGGGLSPFADGFGDVGAAATQSAAAVTSSQTKPINTPVTTPPAKTEPSAPAPSAKTGTPVHGDFPLGTPGTSKGFVRSPYPPYQELDVTEIASGSLALDPSVGKVFRVP